MNVRAGSSPPESLERPMFSKICSLYGQLLNHLIVFLGLALLFSVGMQVAGRYIPFIPNYLWTLEISRFSLIWMIFLGSVIALKDRRHFYIDVFQNIDPAGKVALLLRLLYYAVILVVTYIFLRYGYRYFNEWGRRQTSDVTNINLGYLYASVPVAGFSWLLFLIEGIWTDFFRKKDSAA